MGWDAKTAYAAHEKNAALGREEGKGKREKSKSGVEVEGGRDERVVVVVKSCRVEWLTFLMFALTRDHETQTQLPRGYAA